MANNSLIKKGKCLNVGECDNANTKKVLEVDTLEPFVCPNCKTDLIPVKEGSGSNKILLVACAAVLLLGAAGGAWWYMSQDKAAIENNGESFINPGEETENGSMESVIQPGEGESIGQNPTTEEDENTRGVDANEVSTEEPVDEKPAVIIDQPDSGDDSPLSGRGTISYTWGKYKGDIQNGKPHGDGTLTYFKTTLMSDKDSSKRQAEPGDYVEGSFRNGKITNVKWFGKDGIQKGTLIIGSSGLD